MSSHANLCGHPGSQYPSTVVASGIIGKIVPESPLYDRVYEHTFTMPSMSVLEPGQYLLVVRPTFNGGQNCAPGGTADAVAVIVVVEDQDFSNHRLIITGATTDSRLSLANSSQTSTSEEASGALLHNNNRE